MNQPYPVIEQRSLAPVPNRRIFGPRRTRTLAEIPQGNANNRLVYRIEGDYVLDNAALSLDSPEVLAASHVTLVDVSKGTEVMVQLDIPSKDADSFTLQVTFVCAVTEPVVLVREGVHDVESALRAYLKGHHRIFELGLDYRLSEINDVRRKLNAQVKAYTTMDPPLFLGLTAELASVEVLTPDELATFNQSLREQDHQHAIAHQQQTNRHLLQSSETNYEHVMASRSQRHELDLDNERRTYQRYQYQEQADSVSTDPRSALTYAYSVGDISAKEYAEEMLQLNQAEVDAARADVRQQREWEREDARELRGWERDERLRKWEAERADSLEEWRHKNRRLDFDRDERRLLQEWQREDQAFDREDKRRHLEANIDIIRELAKRGHLDTANVNLEKVVNTILGERHVELKATSAPMSELAPAAPERPTDGDRDEDAEVREEDAH